MGPNFQAYRQANDEMAAAAAAGMTMSPQYQEVAVRSQRACLLLRAGLSMLRRFVLWIRHDQLLTPEHDFVSVFLALGEPPRARTAYHDHAMTPRPTNTKPACHGPTNFPLLHPCIPPPRHPPTTHHSPATAHHPPPTTHHHRLFPIIQYLPASSVKRPRCAWQRWCHVKSAI